MLVAKLLIAKPSMLMKAYLVKRFSERQLLLCVDKRFVGFLDNEKISLQFCHKTLVLFPPEMENCVICNTEVSQMASGGVIVFPKLIYLHCISLLTKVAGSQLLLGSTILPWLVYS